MYGCFLAKARGAKTIAFGTHVTPIPVETMRPYPALDYVLVGEPDLALRDLLDHLENKINQRSPEVEKLFEKQDPSYKPAIREDNTLNMNGIKGLAWRRGEEIVLNFPRPFIADLNDMPIPMHELLPLQEYRMPLIKGPFTFIVTSRGCPAGCTYCIKHVSYQYGTRLRSPELLIEEMWQLKKLGIHNIHMYADLFTVNRDQVVKLCKLMIEEDINIKWTCNSRVDYVDEEMLDLMGQAGNWLISWGIESGNEQILRHARKGAYPDKAERARCVGPGKPVSRIGAISSLAFLARQRRPFVKPLTSQSVYRSISPFSMWLRRIQERHSSLRLLKMAGSGREPVGSRSIWIGARCWIIRAVGRTIALLAKTGISGMGFPTGACLDLL